MSENEIRFKIIKKFEKLMIPIEVDASSVNFED